MKALRRGNWPWSEGMCLWYHPSTIDSRHGRTITPYYKRRHEIERLFRRLKGFRRLFSRVETLDVMFVVFIHFALIVEGLR